MTTRKRTVKSPKKRGTVKSTRAKTAARRVIGRRKKTGRR